MIGAIARKIASFFVFPPERLEVTLVHELEVAYSSGTAPAAVPHARDYQWANACHDLFEAGRIDIVEYAARYLHPFYPELTYLATLVALFDAMPRHPPAPLAFRNEPTEEIQVVRRPDCDTVLLCFCAAGGNLGPAGQFHSSVAWPFAGEPCVHQGPSQFSRQLRISDPRSRSGLFGHCVPAYRG